MAGCSDSRRISRQTRISVATPSAAQIAGISPKNDDTGTNTRTGSDE